MGTIRGHGPACPRMATRPFSVNRLVALSPDASSHRTQNPRLFVMDIRMPRMDGIEALVAGLGDPRSDAADAFIIMSSDFGELKKKVRDPLEE